MLRNTSSNSSYLTFASGGYIITINPIAIGMLVVPEDILFQNPATEGNNQPENTPRNMARNIQRVRKRSKNLSLVFIYSNSLIIHTAVDGQIELNSLEAAMLSGTKVRSLLCQPIFGKNPAAVVVSR